jgi:hypothetical protein
MKVVTISVNIGSIAVNCSATKEGEMNRWEFQRYQAK